MALNKSRLSLKANHNDLKIKNLHMRLDDDGDSIRSYGEGPQPRLGCKYAWGQNDRVNHDNFIKMVEEHREAKKREAELDLKAKQLSAQLARTEEAAKRALVQSDATAKGGAAQKLLDAERSLSRLREENAELRSKLSRERKRANDLKAALDECKHRLDTTLRDQRLMARKVGDLERKNATLSRKPEDEYWGEEAGRRFVVQQEELVALREENAQLRKQLTAEGLEVGGGANTTQVDSELAACQAQVNELQALVKFYEKKLNTLASEHVIPAQEGIPGGPSPDDWILEDHYDKDTLFLLDRKTSKLFSVPSTNTWPHPVGMRANHEVKLGSNNKMDRFLNNLDEMLKAESSKLEQVFKEFDLDGSGQLDRREMQRLIARLMPDLESRQVEELRTMLDIDGDGLVSFKELLTVIKDAFSARMAVKMGRSAEVNQGLERVRDVLRSNRKVVREAFDALDTDNDGCLNHLDVVRLVRQFLRDLVQSEVRLLLARLQGWDVAGEGRASLDEVYQCLELVKIYRVGQGMGGKAQPVTAGRPTSPGPTSMVFPNMRTIERQSTAQGFKEGFKEGFLRDRMAQLEAELNAAQRREGALETDARKVDILRRDLALAKARIEELEKDYMRLDVLVKMDAAGATGDDKLHAAWEAASQFKKRYMEHKAELDTIRLAAARMQAQLDETHKLLHDEHKRRFKLEDDNTRLNLELQRIKDLETRLAQERTDRVKLEREFLELQAKALSAPGAALGEVRQLREERFALQRDKALAEQKEAEVRRELSSVREQLDGMSIDQYRAWQREYGELKKRVVALELELQAANDKLEVYRRTEPPATSNIIYGGKDLPSFIDRRPDADKNEDEVRRELIQLRDVWHADQQELTKLHKVLETESQQTLEAKAALEEVHREMARLRRDNEDRLRAMQRELDRRDERIRKLELQLRGAYSGINRALRSSRLRDSRATDSPDDLSELGDDQNLLELHVSEATLYEEALGKDPSTFFTFDFFMHDTQATPVAASNTPAFNTLVQYVVDADTFLVEYLDTHVLELELNRARGWDYDPIGVARVPLRQVLEDVEIGAALGHNRAYHYADIFGADGKRVGRVRYGFAFRRPLDTLIKDYRIMARTRRPSEPDPRDPATVAVDVAQTKPAAASHIKAIIARCEGLVSPTGRGASMKPYVWYRFPGHRDPHSTRAMEGLHPVFNDEASWLIARTPELEHNLRTREIQFVVFDDAGGEDPLRGIVGVAFVPLAALGQGTPVEGAFKLINPVSKQPAGKIILGLGWHNPLALPTAPPPSTTTRPAAPAVQLGGDGPGRDSQPPPPNNNSNNNPPNNSNSRPPLPQFPPRSHFSSQPPPGNQPPFPPKQNQQFGLDAEVQQAANTNTFPRVPENRFGTTPPPPAQSQSPLVPPTQGYGYPPPPPPPPAQGFGSSLGSPPLAGNMFLNNSGNSHGGGRQRYSDVDASTSSPPLPPRPSSALVRLGPHPADWPSPANHIILAIRDIQLSPHVASVPGLPPYVFVMHALLDDPLCVPAGQMVDTCTMPVARTAGVLPLGYQVAYNVAAPPGSTAAARQLAPGNEFYLDLKLFSCADQRVDLGRQGSMIELGVAEVSLNGMAAGSVADLMQMPLQFKDDRTGEVVGVVTVTLLASAALRALPRPGVPAPGTAPLPYGAAAGRPPGVGSSMTPTNYPGYSTYY